MKITIGLSEKQQKGSIDVLNTLLADEYVLYTKTRNYHWNVTGPHFIELHKFFEAQYDEIDKIIDDVAERARSLGGKSLGTLKDFLNTTRLKESPTDVQSADKMIANLLADHEAIIVALRKDLATCSDTYNDMGTSDFLTGTMEQHEKMAWMLRSFLA